MIGIRVVHQQEEVHLSLHEYCGPLSDKRQVLNNLVFCQYKAVKVIYILHLKVSMYLIQVVEKLFGIA